MPNFPHMKETEFPHIDNVDVYKYQNELDYTRYDYSQMKIMMCTVPWDMGEAHVGNRTISGIGNVVYFGDKEKRDAWFAAIPEDECIRFDTKFKELHRDNEIIVPVPFDVAAKYNYLTVEYSLFANDESPLQYETENGLQQWFWFIREVEFVAPNATKLHLLNDAWQTFIYDVDIPYMVLERGHAPMFATSVSEFLKNPLNNSAGLLEPDSVLENSNTKVADSEHVVFDEGDMYAVFVTSAAINGSWGTNKTNNWKTPASARYHTDGNLSYSHIAVAAEDLYDFLVNIETEHPQFKQTVQCVYLISAKLVTITATYTFGGVSVHLIGCTRKTEQLLKLDADMFGYDEKYKNIAKLYTFPYAYIEITDESGDVHVVKIEDTTGTLSAEYCFNTAFPALNLNAHISGIGSGSNEIIDFKNIGTRHFRIGGKWYDIQYDWAIPQFGVILEASKEYDYSGYFDREQAVVDYTAAYNNAKTDADTAKANADASATTAKANADDSANAAYDNADVVADSNAFREGTETNYLNSKFEIAGEKVNAERAISATNSWRSTQTALNNAALSVVTGAATQVASGALTGGAAGGLMALGSSALSGLSTFNVAGNDANLAYYTIQNQILHMNNMYGGVDSILDFHTQPNNYGEALQGFSGVNNKSLIGREVALDRVVLQNRISADTSVTRANATINRAVVKGGTGGTFDTPTLGGRNFTGTAVRSENTAKANATRSRNAVYNDNKTGTADRNRAAAIDRIANTTRTESLKAPYSFGTWANAENANVKPKMLTANVITQGAAGIAYAGDEMLRYGYRYNRNYEFDGNWCIGKYYTYWKLSDFWVKGLNVPDMYMDKLRFFLFGGVTVWSDPAAIGNVSIYQNWR